MCLNFRGDRVDCTILAMTNKVQWVMTTTLLLSAASFGASLPVDPSKVHERMTDEELLSVFHVKDRSAVPDYEIVPVFHEKREVHRTRRSLPPTHGKGHYHVTLKNLELYLEPVDHLLLGEETPVYKASGNRSSPLGISYEKIQKVWPSTYSAYQDQANKAAVLGSKDTDGKMYFEGIIGNDLVIKPVPWRFRDVAEDGSKKNGSSDHFVYKKKSFLPFDMDEYMDWSDYFDYVSPRKPQPPRTESKVDIVYPEVLVIVDYETYRSHGKSLQALCKYIALFWNAVDLRFRAMKNPEIRLNIAGLIVPIDDGGAPYLMHHRLGQHFLRASETFDAVGRYLHREQRLANDMYDLSVVMSNYNLCSTKRNGCDPSTLGLARVAGVCQHDEDDADVAVAVIEDHNVFDGVFTAAHEIAHLLGAVHDGENSYFGPGAADCDGSTGNLMASSQQPSSDAFLWSICSINQMSYFLRREGECLRNKPVLKKPIAKTLPGQLMSRDEQCSVSFGRKMVACHGIDGDECGKLYCRKPGDNFGFKCISANSPVEGSSCSDGGMCLDGLCVHEVEDDNEVSKSTATTAAPKRRELISMDDD